MTRTLLHTVSVALAATVLAAPAALARPTDASPSAVRAAPRAERQQDLRHLRAGNAGYTPGSSLAHPAPRSRQPGPPTWPVNPQPIEAPTAVDASDSASGLDWTTIGLGFTGGLLIVGGIVAVAVHSRRVGRANIAA